jgi:hypothetical protein
MKTIREIRKMLFDTDKGLNFSGITYSNKEARDFLYSLENQEEEVFFIETEFTISISRI